MPDLKLDNVDAQLEAEHIKPTNNRFGGLLCYACLKYKATKLWSEIFWRAH